MKHRVRKSPKYSNIGYRGTIYNSIKELYESFGSPACCYATFLTRYRRGWPIKKAAMTKREPFGWRRVPVMYAGIIYNSKRDLYKHLVSQQRSVDRLPGLTYCAFSQIARKRGMDTAIRKFLIPKEVGSADKKCVSVILGGADNLVCQRMTKLGWSREKAESTPLVTKSLAKKVIYRGVEYRSISSCYKSVKPKMSLPKFKGILSREGCIVG